MEDGSYCYPLSTYPTEVEIHLRPSDYPKNSKRINEEIMGEVLTTPASLRKLQMEMSILHPPATITSTATTSTSTTTTSSTTNQQHHHHYTYHQHRRHAVCTVQTFKNQFSGSMLYFFITYYQLMGWRYVIVCDSML